MSDRELYQKTFAQVHSAASIRWEDYAHRKSGGTSPGGW